MKVYHYVYTDHTDDYGNGCPYSGRPVASDVIDVTDPHADDDEVLCPQDCNTSAIEHE